MCCLVYVNPSSCSYKLLVIPTVNSMFMAVLEYPLSLDILNWKSNMKQLNMSCDVFIIIYTGVFIFVFSVTLMNFIIWTISVRTVDYLQNLR